MVGPTRVQSSLCCYPLTKMSQVVGVARTLRCQPTQSRSGLFGGRTKCRKSQTRPASRALSAKVVCVLDVTEANFEAEVLQSKIPVMVDFWATWCGPCKLVAPSMVWAEQEYNGKLKVVKINADPNPNLVEKYKVYGLPTLKLFRDGAEVEGSHNEGALTKQGIVKWLEKHGVQK